MDVFLESLREAGRLLVSGDGYVWQILLLSLRVSGAGVLLGLLIGLPIGIAVGLLRFPGRGLVISLIHTGFALPPVVVGLFVYMVFSRSGPAGHLELLFTPAAMIIAQALLAAPYVAGISMAAVQAVPPDVRLQARGLGASPARALRTHLAEARLGIFAAVVAGFGAVISEVGAVMMVGGNIAGETRVMTTAIVLETRRGNFAPALAFGLVLLFLAFVVNALLTRAQQARTRAGVHRPFA
ncbi:MAG: ABC transporter permease [Candidatus Cloacimonetes bacterium]|nr:ABC transporter permease [Candidatus Cloacimonadota bacterium]